MDKNLEQFAQNIARHINNEELSLFLGAGITTIQWKKLFDNKKNYDKFNLSNYLKLQMIANEYTDFSDFIRKMKSILVKSSLNGNYLDTLINLNIRHIWTTNFDKNIENLMLKSNIHPEVIFKESKLKFIESSGKKIIYKINGDLEDLENAVITQEQYEKHQERMNLFSSFLEKELLVKKFLIIGYSFTDNIFLKSIAKLNNYFADATNECYNIIDEKTWKKKKFYYEDMQKRYKITPVILKTYDELEYFVKRIKHYCLLNNVYISGSINLEKNRNDEKLISSISSFFENLFEKNLKLHSNHGEFLGYHLGASATKYAFKNNLEFNDVANIFPIYINEQSEKYRRTTISQTKATIIMFSDDKISNGIIDEFIISYENKNIIIPLHFTGKTPQIIFSFMSKNKILFPELDPFWDDLISMTSLENSSLLIYKIISCIQKNDAKIDRSSKIRDLLYEFINSSM